MLLKDAMKAARARAVHERELESWRRRYEIRIDSERKRKLNYHFEHRDMVLKKGREKWKMANEAKKTRDVVIVDVDNTLYDFTRELCRVASASGKHIEECDLTYWDALYKYIEPEDGEKMIDEVHKNQILYKPYDGARDLLDCLFKNYYVIIASHRKKEMKRRLSRWLQKNELKYHRLLVFDHTTGRSKSEIFLFNRHRLREKVKLVIDDNPEILSAAKDAEITAVGLRKPWNQGNGFVLFDNLRDIEEFVSYVRHDGIEPGAVAF